MARTSIVPARPSKPLLEAPVWLPDYHGAIHYMIPLYALMGSLGLEPCAPSSPFSPNNAALIKDIEGHCGGLLGLPLASVCVDWRKLATAPVMNQWNRETIRLPRIAVTAQITKKGNLTVGWYPAVRDNNGQIKPYGWTGHDLAETDFTYFTGDDPPAYQRPPNELMFLHGAGYLRAGMKYSVESAPPLQLPICQHLACAVTALFNQLIGELRTSFDVTLLSRPVVLEETVCRGEGEGYVSPKIVGWDVV
jgi:hypothetical protein